MFVSKLGISEHSKTLEGRQAVCISAFYILVKVTSEMADFTHVSIACFT